MAASSRLAAKGDKKQMMNRIKGIIHQFKTEHNTQPAPRRVALINWADGSTGYLVLGVA